MHSIALDQPGQKLLDIARLRIQLTYLWRHGRMPNLDDPVRFTELVQMRKLFDRDSRMVVLSDKIAAKAAAADLLGAEWTVPTLWQGDVLPASSPLSEPAMLKARHGCNQYRAIRTAPTCNEWAGLRKLTDKWTAEPYGFWLDECCYRDVPRGLLAEKMIGGDTLPVDYKIYVFGGVATHVQVHQDRAGDHRWILHDRDYRQLVPSNAEGPKRPRSLNAMLEAAETLARGFSFARVDFYEVDRTPLFGEFCFYPGSGLDPFAADWVDEELGRLWLGSL